MEVKETTQEGSMDLDNLIDDILSSDQSGDFTTPMKEQEDNWDVLTDEGNAALVWEMEEGEPLPEEVKDEEIKEVEEEADKIVEEEVKNEEVKPNVDDVQMLSDEDLLKELEDELRSLTEVKEETQDAITQIEWVTEDKKIAPEEYNEIVNAYNILVENNDILNNELERTKALLDRYKEEVKNQASQLSEKELSNVMASPIVETVNWDNNLKWFVLAINKSSEKPELKDRAMDYLYNYIEKETGINVKDVINKENESKKLALTGTNNTGDVSMQKIENKEDDDFMSDIKNMI